MQLGCRDEESSAVQSESPPTPGSAPPLVEPPGVSESKAVKHEKLFFSCCCCVRSLTLSFGSACGAQRGWEAGAEPADSAAQSIRVGLQRGSRWAVLVPTSTALYVTASRDTRTVHFSARATHSPGELLFTEDCSGASHPVFAPPAALLRPSVNLAVLPPSAERCSDALLRGASRKQRSSYSGVMKLLRRPPSWRVPDTRGFRFSPLRI